jgi:hypothetical protein
MKHLQKYEKFIFNMKGRIDMDDIESDVESYLSDNENFELMKVQVRNMGNNLFSVTATERFPNAVNNDEALELNNGILPYIAKECGAELQNVRVSGFDYTAVNISFYLQYPQS